MIDNETKVNKLYGAKALLASSTVDFVVGAALCGIIIWVMMPCTFGVWEGEDGKVYVSKMNMGLMAKMFGGNIAKVMGGHVAEDEERILEGLLKD